MLLNVQAYVAKCLGKNRYQSKNYQNSTIYFLYKTNKVTLRGVVPCLEVKNKTNFK